VKVSNGLIRSALVSVIVGCCVAAGNGLDPGARGENPFAPAYGHSYRHGAVPTREALEKMRAWEASHPVAMSGLLPIDPLNTLSFGGGIDGIGVTSSTPRVYLVFYGSQWTGGGDPDGAATYLQHLFAGIGTGGELWSGTMTQYCDGPLVSAGATSCPSGAPHVGYPASGALAGVWFDTAGPSPGNATASQLAAEAARAAAHFGNTTPAANRYVQYVVVSPSGTHPDGFNTPTSNFCAWHDYVRRSGVHQHAVRHRSRRELRPEFRQRRLGRNSRWLLDRERSRVRRNRDRPESARRLDQPVHGRGKR